jgi:multiple sugar transport system permease protein
MDPVLYNYAHVFEYEGQDLDVYIVQTTTGRTRKTFEWALVSENPDTGEAFYIDTKRSGDLITVTNNMADLGGDEPEELSFKRFREDLEIYLVPIEDGTTKELAALKKTRRSVTFIDPNDPDAEPYEWEGRYQTLSQKLEFAPRTGNFATAWRQADFPLLLRNTIAIAFIGMFGTLLSSICVAYAFARFPIPGKNILFMILIGTIILPSQVRLVPTYTFYAQIDWTGTWLPLTVPHFFANAYNVFLLRQYFLTLPREMDEAAMIDGAGPLTILVRIIVPLSWPAIVAVALFHFVFAWNDYFEPLIYLLGKRDLVPISVGIQQFNFIYDQQPHLIQATSLLALVVPVAIFFAAQRFFMRGVVVTGVEK